MCLLQSEAVELDMFHLHCVKSLWERIKATVRWSCFNVTCAFRGVMFPLSLYLSLKMYKHLTTLICVGQVYEFDVWKMNIKTKSVAYRVIYLCLHEHHFNCAEQHSSPTARLWSDIKEKAFKKASERDAAFKVRWVACWETARHAGKDYPPE